MLEFVLTSNSPGEVAGWLTPVAETLVERFPTARLLVFLPPCDFASGSEKAVASTLPGISRVFGPGEYVRFALTGRLPGEGIGKPRRRGGRSSQGEGYRQAGNARKGAVLFLGGDLLHAVLLSRRFGLPAFAYTEGFARWSGRFERFFLPDERAWERARHRYGAPPEKLLVVGNLMVDAVHRALRRARGDARSHFDHPYHHYSFILLPGSRPSEFRQVLGLFVRAALDLVDFWSSRYPGLPVPQPVMLLSPFISWELVEETLAGGREHPDRFLFPLNGRLEPPPAGRPAGPAADAEIRMLVTGGKRLPVYRASAPARYQLMEEAAAALCLPGTVTMEMAALGLPHVAALPLQRPDLVPLPGVAGVLGGLPGVGGSVRRAAVRRVLAGRRLFSWPNRLAGSTVVPEVVGEVTPARLADALATLLAGEIAYNLKGRVSPCREQLQRLAGPAGAARRLVEAMARDLLL